MTPPVRLTRILAITSALILASGLGACGKVGQLDRPGPLFGAKTKAAEPSEKQDPTRPVETVDPRDRSTDNLPPRTAPIPGDSPGATRTAPPTAFPDPYANPK